MSVQILPLVDTVGNFLKNALSTKFETVIVSKTELKTAEDVMKGQLMDCWEEKMVYDVTRGVPKENLEEFTECLAVSLGLDEEQKAELASRMKVMKFAKSKDSSILEMNFNFDEYKSVYGFVSMVQEEDKTIAIAYAFHKLNFKMAAKVVNYVKKTTKTRKFLFWDLSPEVTTTNEQRYERVKFGENDINAIKNAFGRHKALETLRREGVINAIKYED